MKRALVIGGGGFIGRHLCLGLCKSGWDVYVADIASLQRDFLGSDNAVKGTFCLDLTQVEDFAPYLEGIDVVFYLASTTLPQTSNEEPVFDVVSNLVPVIRFLESARNFRSLRVIYASSGGTIYGPTSDCPISEEHPNRPVCSYGIVKLAVEKYFHLYRQLHGVDSYVLRLANPYGVGQNGNRPQGAIGVFLSRILSGQPISLWGDGSVVRDYIHIRDVVSAFLSTAEYRGQEWLFNIGSGGGTSLNELLDIILTVSGRDVDITRHPSRHFDVPVNVLNIGRAKSQLGWRPCIQLNDGIRQVWNTLLNRAAGHE